ncbi:MAG: PEP-CTERM system histidine kinase PrsK [Sphingomonadales bacterium]|nr:MAG: PEP-CTERM system histidine kinase PrsK [Sphingomonadales bacterium]
MMQADFSILPALTQAMNVLGAIACVAAILWIVQRGDPVRIERNAAILAISLAGIWSVIAAAFGPASFAAELAESARNISWIYLLFRLFGNDGRDESVRLIRPVVFTLFAVELLQPFVLIVGFRLTLSAAVTALAHQLAAILHLLVTIGALVLLHNLYAGAATASRQLLRLSAVALAGVWLYDLNLHTVAYLTGDSPEILFAVRGLVTAIFAILLATGSSAAGVGLQFKPSRAVAFRSLSLLLIGGYFVLMIAITQSLAILGGDLGRITQVGFLVFAGVVAILWLPSTRLRGGLRVLLAKHLFRHRYDYRSEWLRFTQTIGRGGGTSESLFERAVQAVADITDSPKGLLLAPNEEAQLELVARWQWPDLDVPSPAADYQLAGAIEQSDYIFDLDEIRQSDGASELRMKGHEWVPQWLLDLKEAWAVVPLIHFERLVGVVVLARPPLARSLDWEDFDLLRAAGRQLASYLAEQSGQQALMEASRFDEFNRRIAFVMHDIKNLASQLSLLARNAEKHAENPDFRADMLITLRNSAEKLNTLLARLGRYGTGKIDGSREVDLLAIAKDLMKRFGTVHEVQLSRAENCLVRADPEALEQALQHLMQNAIDASSASMPIILDVSSDGLNGRIEIVDSGVGMTPEFIRSGLFKPFVSSKEGGFGIGAFEARELIRALGGRLNVESREGLGTRFIVCLPMAATVGALSNEDTPESEVA